jgi:hypothetical protein
MANRPNGVSRRGFLGISGSLIAAARWSVDVSGAAAAPLDVVASDNTNPSTSERHDAQEEANMPTGLNDNLPEVLKVVRTRPLFVMRLDVRPLLVVGATPGEYRRIGIVPGGAFEGERLSGNVLDGGSDWQTVHTDAATILNVRLVLKTTDDALVCMTYRGIRHGRPDIVERIEKGEVVDPMSYYFRINPLFETASPKYDWLNRIIAIGIGHRRADGPIYSVFEVL